VNTRKKSFYRMQLGFGLLLASLFTYGLFQPNPIPPALRSLCGLFAAIFFLGVLQAIERLVWPDRAKRRALTLRSSLRRPMRIVFTALIRISIAAFIASACLRIFGDQNLKDEGTDAGMIAVVIGFAATCLADLVGEDVAPPGIH
jgi:hypothetical protein